MANKVVTFTIKSAIVAEFVDMVSSRHGIPENAAGVPLFTPNQWAKEYYRRLMKRELLAYRHDKQIPTPVPDPDIT